MEQADELLEPLPKRAGKAIRENVERGNLAKVYVTYNAAPWHATHQIRNG